MNRITQDMKYRLSVHGKVDTVKNKKLPCGNLGYQFFQIPSGRLGDHGNKSSRNVRSLSSI